MSVRRKLALATSGCFLLATVVLGVGGVVYLQRLARDGADLEAELRELEAEREVLRKERAELKALEEELARLRGD